MYIWINMLRLLCKWNGQGGRCSNNSNTNNNTHSLSFTDKRATNAPFILWLEYLPVNVYPSVQMTTIRRRTKDAVFIMIDINWWQSYNHHVSVCPFWMGCEDKPFEAVLPCVSMFFSSRPVCNAFRRRTREFMIYVRYVLLSARHDTQLHTSVDSR